jgi:hypothetical protein
VREWRQASAHGGGAVAMDTRVREAAQPQARALGDLLTAPVEGCPAPLDLRGRRLKLSILQGLKVRLVKAERDNRRAPRPA